MAIPHPAASLLLLTRAAPHRILLLQRPSTAKTTFASAHVFPGGATSSSDLSPTLTALRETFEETGLLLTRSRPPSSLSSSSSSSSSQQQQQDLESARQLVHDQKLNFSTWLAKNNMELTSEIAPFSTWITPPNMSRRFDTKFFVALLPEWLSMDEAQRTVAATVASGKVAAEVVDARFYGLEEVLREENGLRLYPPQAWMVRKVDELLKVGEGDLEDLWKWARSEGERLRIIPRAVGRSVRGEVVVTLADNGGPMDRVAFRDGMFGRFLEPEEELEVDVGKARL